jgi:hypothetical protein
MLEGSCNANQCKSKKLSVVQQEDSPLGKRQSFGIPSMKISKHEPKLCQLRHLHVLSPNCIYKSKQNGPFRFNKKREYVS